MIIEVKENVEVGTINASKAKMKPVWINWRYVSYKVTKLLNTWSVRKGETVFHHYSITDDLNIYHLCYNSKTMKWLLVTIDDCQNYHRTYNIAC